MSYTTPTAQATKQYTELFEQGQKALQNAVDTWTKTVRNTADQFGAPSATTLVEPEVVIDQVFDFAVKMLEVQRDFSKQLLAAATEAGEVGAAAAKAATQA